jgi:RNA polymerase sigma-B factor
MATTDDPTIAPRSDGARAARLASDRHRPDALLEAYREHGSIAARRRVIEAHVPLVEVLARRFARRGEPIDDLVQVGCIGLIHAVDRFEPGRGAGFEAYAVPTIVGEIQRHLRDGCSAVRVPRRLQEQRARVRHVATGFTARTGRSPTTRELVHATGLEPDEVVGALVAEAARTPAQLAPDGDDEPPPVREDPIGAAEDRATIAAALGTLDVRERRILALRFYRDLNQREIATEVGLSQVHVSRLMRSALSKLRGALDDIGPGPVVRPDEGA